MANSEILSVERNGAVARVTLRRPEVHNAFNETLIAAITEAFDHLNHDAAVRVIVLTGEGRSFSAGADLHWMGRMAGFTREENLADAVVAQRMFAAIANSPKMTIARVQGAAMGGGAGLVAACDLAIAAESAVFAFSEVRLGIIPAIISPYVLAKMPVGTAKALFLTARRFSATDALRFGLVQEVVHDSELDAAVDRTVQEALQAGPQAVAAVKQLLVDLPGMMQSEAATETAARIADIRVSEEGQEGIRAFLEKRKPGWYPT